MRNRIWLLSLTLIILTALAACGPTSSASPTSAPALIPAPTLTVLPTLAPTVAATTTPAAFPLTITDGAERKVTITKQPLKIVSLAPSVTEILFAIGQGGKLIARDDFSDYPAEAKALPKMGGFKPNFEQIVALNPDLVLAASITSADNIKKLEDLKLVVVVVGARQTTIDGVLSDIALVGKIVGAPDKAKQVTADMQQRLDALKAKAASAKSKPKVYWELDGTDPGKPYTVGPGNFVNDLIVFAAGENAFAKAALPYAQVGSEQVVSANPDVIILSDFAYGVTVESVKARKGWESVNAIKNNKVFPIDDNLVSRPGPRVVEGLEAAMRLIHPELFQ